MTLLLQRKIETVISVLAEMMVSRCVGGYETHYTMVCLEDEIMPTRSRQVWIRLVETLTRSRQLRIRPFEILTRSRQLRIRPFGILTRSRQPRIRPFGIPTRSRQVWIRLVEMLTRSRQSRIRPFGSLTRSRFLGMEDKGYKTNLCFLRMSSSLRKYNETLFLTRA